MMKLNAPETPRWTTLPRWAVGAAVWLAALAALLAWVLSYSSQVALALQHSYVGWQAALWPLTTDLVSLALMIVAMDAADTQRRSATVRAGFLTVLSALVMIAGNAIIAWPDIVAIAMHTWPPFIGAALWFVLAHDRPRRTPVRPVSVSAPDSPDIPDGPGGGQRTPVRQSVSAPDSNVRPELSAHPRVRALPAGRVSIEEYRAAVRELGPDATTAQIADRLNVTERTVRRLRQREREESARPRVVSS